MKELVNFGLINIDKPTGPTSHTISDYVRKRLGLSKASHMGTLDPKVTGVLPITLGRACRLAAHFIRHDKTYVGVLHTHKEQKIAELQKLINEKFVGRIKQTPPNRAAVKRAEREREVYFWNLLEESDTGKDFLFEAKVEGGTYIRKLCSDLGELIGGAHMGELRRTEAGIFEEGSLISLSEFDSAVDAWKKGDEGPLKKMIIPAEEAIKKVLPFAEIERKNVGFLLTGKPLYKEYVSKLPKIDKGASFALFSGADFVGVYSKVGDGEVLGKAEFVYLGK
jgi:predicted rRNA pseudouridine synthase